MMRRLFAIGLVSGVIGGCFSAPTEPDWTALSEGMLLQEEDVVEDSVSPVLDTAIFEDVPPLDSSEEGGEGAEEDASLPDTSLDEDIEIPDTEGPCLNPNDEDLCSIVGATRCAPDKINAVETCFDPGETECPYWLSEFCGAKETCEEGVCSCSPVCPEDGTCGMNDGCGGQCGCADDLVCQEGICQCQPECPEEGDTCGLPDGCGGLCPDFCLPEVLEEGEELSLCTERSCKQITSDEKQCVVVNKPNGDSCGDGGETCLSGTCVQ